jgi:hypothetical protein
MKKLLYILLFLPAWCLGQVDTSVTRPGTAMTPSFSYVTIGGKRYPNIYQGNQWYGLVTTQQLNAAIAAATPTVQGLVPDGAVYSMCDVYIKNVANNSYIVDNSRKRIEKDSPYLYVTVYDGELVFVRFYLA